MKAFAALFLVCSTALCGRLLSETPSDAAAFQELLRALFPFDNPVCSVHKVRMPEKDVPVVFGFPATAGIPEFDKVKTQKFPFGDESVNLGCVDDPRFPRTAHILVCPKCAEEQRQWIAAWKKTNDGKPK